ncbi:oxidoreductase [Yamadazyma tenuis]|nr:oxidoreductase [Yamadazyma tenuis]
MGILAVFFVTVSFSLIRVKDHQVHNKDDSESRARINQMRSDSITANTTKPALKSGPLNIVVVGAGLIGPRHAQHVNDNDSTMLFAIIDLNPSTKVVAQNLNTNYFSSIEEMIEYCTMNGLKLPDGAIICTPNHTHVPVAAKLASFGINLLVEKPVSPTAEESKALKIYSNFKKVKVLVGHHRRFNPFIIATKKNLYKIGSVVAIQGTWALKKHEDYFKTSPWRTNSETGGGTLLINLVHDLDLLQYLFGPIYQVYAESLPKKRGYEKVDEGAALTLRFKSGACGTFICSDNVPSPFNFESSTGENPTVPLHDNLHGLYRIFGSNGTLSIPDFNLYQNHPELSESNTWLNEIRSKRIVDPKVLMKQKPFDSQLNHFVNIINDNHIPNCNIDDGISALLVIQSVQKSLQTGLPQVIPDITDIKPDFISLGLDLDSEWLS